MEKNIERKTQATGASRFEEMQYTVQFGPYPLVGWGQVLDADKVEAHLPRRGISWR